MPIKSQLSTRQQSKAADMFPSTQFQIVQGRLVTIDENPKNYIDKGYSINDIVYSIVTLIMDKIKVAPWNVYTIEDEQALKAYHGLQRKKEWSVKDYRTAIDLRHKALVPVKSPGKLGELLKYANEYETFPELVGNGCGYKLLVGNKYVWADLLNGGANAGQPNELWNLPAQHMSITATDTFPSKVTMYQILTWSLKYQPEEVLHEKYWNPNWNLKGQPLYGMSPLKAALKILARDNSSLESSASRFDNGGVSGILHMKNQVGQVDGNLVLPEVQALKKTMVTEWTGEKQHGKMGLSGYELGWIPIGLTAEEMQQIENEKWNLRRLCSIYGVQSQLLNDPDNKTYANQAEAEKALTTRCALPALTSFRDNFNRKLQKDWGGKAGQIVDFDMSVYSELAENTDETVKWLTPLMDRGLPLNRALDLLNLEKIDDPYFDLPRVTTQMGQTLEEREEMDSQVNDALDDTEEDIS